MLKIVIPRPQKNNKKVDSDIKRQQPKKQPNLPVEEKPEIQQENPKEKNSQEAQKD